jgi:peptidoglycan/xylan/chitin deacetylase (PgdA/CDA1 family)
MYHEITDDPSSSGFQRRGARPYTCSRRTFARHLDLIADAGYIPALVPWLDLSAPRRRLLLTFDDGGRSALDASEELARRGWSAHFFVVTARLGTTGFLDSSALHDLHAAGHLVGTHSHTHPDIFRQLPYHEMLTEWRESRDRLEQILGVRCAVGSLPGGDLSAEVAASATEAGLDALFTSEPSLRPWRENENAGWLLGRIAVRRTTTDRELTGLLQLRGWGRALLARRCSVLARRGLGPLYRLYVRHTTAEDRASERCA